MKRIKNVACPATYSQIRCVTIRIDSFHLSDKALASLKQSGIRQVRDLYRADAKQELGWFAVREMFHKILMELNCI